jgi:acetyl-CoA carboxylase biotin carboxyl carrier protein
VSLTARDVAEITRLLEESNFDELYLELDGLKLSLRRGGAATAQPPIGQAPVLSPASSSPAQSASSSAATIRSASANPDALNVSAPLLGTFYRAPKPGAAPFVEIGSHVEEDTIIGIIEVMKLMNTVRAGVRGTVIQVLGRDGELVEYGETLMLVSKAD